MLDVRSLMRCPTCGARTRGGGPVCPGCGATWGPRCPLDRAGGDGAWVIVLRGPRDVVLSDLGADVAAGPDALERLAAARRIVAGLPPGRVSLWLDLRPATAGQAVRRAPIPGGEETVWVLPWLLVRADGEREVRVTRTAHVRAGRGPGGRTASSSCLEEVAVRGPGGGLRRPVRGPARVGVDWGALDADAPPPGPLPPSAPADPATAAGASLGAGLLVAAALLLAAPLLVAPFTPSDPAARDRRVARALVATLSERPDAAALARAADLPPAARRFAARALADAPAGVAPWGQWSGLALLQHLPRVERLRRLDLTTRLGRPHELAAAATDLLGDEGPLGRSMLLAIAQRSPDFELRAVAARAILDRDPRLAGWEAQRVFSPGGGFDASDAVRLVWLHALAVPGAAPDPARARALLEGLVSRGPDAPERARAAWALVSVAPVDDELRLRVALALLRTLDEGLRAPEPAPGVPRAQQLLARALRRTAPPQAWIDGALAHPGLQPAARAALRPEGR